MIPSEPSGRLADLSCWSLWPEFLSDKLKIRHSVYGHLTPRGITPRRLAAAKTALRREREGLALFADQVAAEQETPEERIHRFDQEQVEADERRRDLAAKHWRWGRRQLASLADEIRIEILELWNRSSIPPTAAYFADFVRHELKRRGLPISDDA